MTPYQPPAAPWLSLNWMCVSAHGRTQGINPQTHSNPVGASTGVNAPPETKSNSSAVQPNDNRRAAHVHTHDTRHQDISLHIFEFSTNRATPNTHTAGHPCDTRHTRPAALLTGGKERPCPQCRWSYNCAGVSPSHPRGSMRLVTTRRKHQRGWRFLG